MTYTTLPCAHFAPYIPSANSSARKSSNSSLKIFYSPAKNGKILRTYHFIPPKFHFIPPKNFFLPSWERHPFPANYFEILMSYFPLRNAIWSGARPAPDAPSSPRRAGGAGSELPRRKKGRCAHRPFKVNAVHLLLKQKLSYIQVCI